eukprot:TRINITY_DN11206_c0_g1::TRINITY_DN11206_c0_g1_i1::g.6604::m.6604 TRINITY_DN11206_c0_g1::TRINITY_DN11206_c0_g1_i1::g.6604  ORF type:complete len:303 (-),score=95.29,sp/Q54C49/EIF3F_DICDI/40.22/6e-62,JAB/PF01398.16/1.9e-17,MitMem_reg/PF13012.1/4.7e+03,MitMem_reg/PF13012.1/2e-13 TRINITY_DN11206_c0_g1_i1:505-1371(-)
MADQKEVVAVSETQGFYVAVHPVVFLNIIDHFSRRHTGTRLIGTLLGVIGEGVIEVRNSFPVPHSETESQVAVDVEYHKSMADLHMKVNSKEIIVGWYAVGVNDLQNSNSVLIHDFYGREVSSPVNLIVDASLKTPTIGIDAFVTSAEAGPDKPLDEQFEKLPVKLHCYDAEKIGLDFLKMTHHQQCTTSEPPTFEKELSKLEGTMKGMLSQVNEVLSYVDKVCSGQVKPDDKLGRHLAETLMSASILDSSEFERYFTSNIQDLLMASYLSNLCRTQLFLSERLQQIV